MQKSILRFVHNRPEVCPPQNLPEKQFCGTIYNSRDRGYTLVEVDSNHMEACVILCPHETIISKSEADFDTQRRRRAPRDLEGSVATLLRLPNRFAPLAKVCVVTHFIIVGGFWAVLLPAAYH